MHFTLTEFLFCWGFTGAGKYCVQSSNLFLYPIIRILLFESRQLWYLCPFWPAFWPAFETATVRSKSLVRLQNLVIFLSPCRLALRPVLLGNFENFDSWVEIYSENLQKWPSFGAGPKLLNALYYRLQTIPSILVTIPDNSTTFPRILELSRANIFWPARHYVTRRNSAWCESLNQNIGNC